MTLPTHTEDRAARAGVPPRQVHRRCRQQQAICGVSRTVTHGCCSARPRIAAQRWAARTGGGMGRIIRRVLSRRPKPTLTVISLGTLLPVPSSGLPEDSAGRVIILCLALLRTRFTWPPVLPRTPVVSYTTLSALPEAASHPWRSTLCCTFSRVAPGGRYPPFSPAEPGRSSARALACRDATASPTHSEIYRTPREAPETRATPRPRRAPGSRRCPGRRRARPARWCGSR